MVNSCSGENRPSSRERPGCLKTFGLDDCRSLVVLPTAKTRTFFRTSILCGREGDRFGPIAKLFARDRSAARFEFEPHISKTGMKQKIGQKFFVELFDIET